MTEEVQWSKVQDLGPESRSVNLKIHAIRRNDVREVSSRKDGLNHRVTEILVGDDSAVVFMTVWDDMIETIEDGKNYLLTNGYTSLYSNNIRLNIGKYGKIEETSDAVEAVNEQVNVSDKTYDMPPRRSFRPRYNGGGGRRGYSSDRRGPRRGGYNDNNEE